MGVEGIKPVLNFPKKAVEWFLGDPGIKIAYHPCRIIGRDFRHSKRTTEPQLEPPKNVRPIHSSRVFEIEANGPNEEDWHTSRQMELWRAANSASPPVRYSARLMLIIKQQLMKRD